MKDLYFVAKALPEDKSRHNTPFPSGKLTDLVPLDPRNGVFPNLVATPLLSAVMAYYEDGNVRSALELLDQAQHILRDESRRRINVLCKPAGGLLRLDPEIPSLLKQFNPEQTLWLVFKHSAIYALCKHLLTGSREFTEDDLNAYGAAFLKGCTTESKNFDLPDNRNTQLGLFFRLCTDADADGRGATNCLRRGVERMAPNCDVTRIVAVLRSFVPLLHNDAYDRIPVGLIQARFMAAKDFPPNCPPEHDPAPDVYWRFIGKVICRRLTKLQ
jgi:hypothetical protein